MDITTGASAGSVWIDPMSGIAVPTTAPAYTDALATVGASLLFLLLAVIVPGRASRLAGATLGLSGSDIMAGAATVARFGMMVRGVAGQATRVVSPLLRT